MIRRARNLPVPVTRAGLWLLAVAVVGVLAGPVTGAAWGAVALWHLLRPPPPRVLLVVATTLLALVPVLWVVGNGSRIGQVSSDLVLANRAPAVLASLALALLVTGVWRDVVGPRTAAPPVGGDAVNVRPAAEGPPPEKEIA